MDFIRNGAVCMAEQAYELQAALILYNRIIHVMVASTE